MNLKQLEKRLKNVRKELTVLKQEETNLIAELQKQCKHTKAVLCQARSHPNDGWDKVTIYESGKITCPRCGSKWEGVWMHLYSYPYPKKTHISWPENAPKIKDRDVPIWF